MKHILITSLLILWSVLSASVLIWDAENGSYHFPHPENAGVTASCQVLQETFFELGITYQCVDTLPSDLANYECIYVCLGSWCET
jgi:hypothetical protein